MHDVLQPQPPEHNKMVNRSMLAPIGFSTRNTVGRVPGYLRR